MRWLRRKTAAPFPAAWTKFLSHNIRLYHSLQRQERAKLRKLTATFIAEKNFEGCAGLQVTDEMRVTIGGQACLLLLGRQGAAVYPGVTSILIYPKDYQAREYIRPGIIAPEHSRRLGEAWHLGTLVVSWADVV